MKKCPFCAEEIMDEAVFCKFCKRDLASGNITVATGLTDSQKVRIAEEEHIRAQERAKYAPKPPRKGLGCGGGCLALIILFIVLAWIGSMSSAPSTPTPTSVVSPTPTVNPDRSHGDTAFVCAQQEVTSRLKAPATAKFGGAHDGCDLLSSVDGCVTPLGNEKYTVAGYVDAQNSFGALIRTSYTCSVQVIDPANFQCNTSCKFNN